ncbi:hypothetical protein [Clostridium oceanicum]|uniref:Uncharacterized protein n=1 Tax=Clostridium oceanicum TaxID=1543 RepID=A0ABN1JVC2_9CLOT
MEVINKKKKHKLKWNKYKTVILICFIIFIFGFVTVSNSLPKFVKDKANFSIYFSRKPFDFKIKGKNYTFYINYKVLNNIKSFNMNIGKKINSFFSHGKDFFITISKKASEEIINIKEYFSGIFDMSYSKINYHTY